MRDQASAGAGSAVSCTELRDTRFRSIPEYWTLARILNDNTARFGEYDALIFDGRIYTNRQLADQSRQLAASLRELGVKPGDRIVAHLANSPEVWIT